MRLLLKLIKHERITDRDLEDELYEICERTHSTCDYECPVYEINDGRVPDTAHDFKINRGCDCFKSGASMLEFIRSKSL